VFLYRTIILFVVLYGCETWSLTLREERRLRACENRVLRRIFGPKRDEITREWVIKSRRMRWERHVACMGDMRGVFRILVGKTDGKRPLRRPRSRWGDNIKMDLQKVGFGFMDWIEVAQDRDRWRALVNAVMNLRVS
jgi:hypothetical protein